MNFIKANIYTNTAAIDDVTGALINIGVSGFEIKDSEDFKQFLQNKNSSWDYIDDCLSELNEQPTIITIYIPDDNQGHELLSEVKSDLHRLKNSRNDDFFGSLKIELENVKEEDWENNWKQYYKPFTVGERFIIKPSWEQVEHTDNRIILQIDPASTFGTGQHHTTKLCICELERLVKTNDKVLDIGCGSGILSIAAMQLGAKSAVLVDIFENAVKTAGENMLINNIPADSFKTYCGDICTNNSLLNEIGGGYNIVCANIVADVIIAMSGLFCKLLVKNGILITSGIITERTDEVITALKAGGMEVIKTDSKEGWSVVVTIDN